MHIALGEQNNEHMLVFHAVNLDGQLYDPEQVVFQVFDHSGGSPVQVFPVAGTEDVTTDGRLATGRFLAYDVAMSIGLTPGTSWAATTGLHSIVWSYVDDNGNAKEWEQFFYVETADLAFGVASYIAPAELREEGLDITNYPNAWLLKLMSRAQKYIERACRQTFRPVYQEFLMEGSGAPRIHLSQPIIGIESVEVNDSETKLDNDAWRAKADPTYKAHTGFLATDHKRNPVIELVGRPSLFQGGRNSIFHSRDSGYDAHRFRGSFISAPGSQKVTGVFGFLEPDGNPPDLIKQAMERLIFNTAARLTPGGSGGSGPAGPLKRLRVDRHEQEWDTSASTIKRTSALATDAEVEEIIKLYRAPIAMAGSGSGP